MLRRLMASFMLLVASTIASAQVSYPPSSTPFRGALANKSAAQVAANYSTLTAVAWDQEQYDTDNIHDNVTNNSRFTVPSGATKARFTFCMRASSVSVGAQQMIAEKNGLTTFVGFAGQSWDEGGTAPTICAATPVVSVVAGDYFEAYYITVDTSVDVGNTAWAALEIIQ